MVVNNAISIWYSCIIICYPQTLFAWRWWSVNGQCAYFKSSLSIVWVNNFLLWNMRAYFRVHTSHSFGSFTISLKWRCVKENEVNFVSLMRQSSSVVVKEFVARTILKASMNHMNSANVTKPGLNTSILVHYLFWYIECNCIFYIAIPWYFLFIGRRTEEEKKNIFLYLQLKCLPP